MTVLAVTTSIFSGIKVWRAFVLSNSTVTEGPANRHVLNLKLNEGPADSHRNQNNL